VTLNPAPGPIVVGHDGSEASDLAVAFVADLAARAGAEVVIVRAFEPLAEVGHVPPPVDFGQVRDDVTADLAAQRSRPLAEAGVAHRVLVVDGPPRDVLPAAVRDLGAWMVVVGSHGRSGWRDRLHGSTTLALPHHVTCPVVVVPLPTPG
jgi:nucleotide-binding universal stress UspA family protein